MTNTVHGITVDYSRDSLFDVLGLKRLKESYMKEEENSKVQGEDYYLSEEGYFIFTEEYHLKRGYCCESNCRHCPYGYNP